MATDDQAFHVGAIYHQQSFRTSDEIVSKLEDSVYRYCTISVGRIEGGHVTSTFLSTSFHHVDWYWGLFNLCNFIECRFEDARFAAHRSRDADSWSAIFQSVGSSWITLEVSAISVERNGTTAFKNTAKGYRPRC